MARPSQSCFLRLRDRHAVYPEWPSIPDELLVARDAGDVIFFCGAGVSQHEAGFSPKRGRMRTLQGRPWKSPVSHLRGPSTQAFRYRS